MSSFAAVLAFICLQCAQAAEGYNCMSRELWTSEKQAWCCEHENLGCPTRSRLSALEEESKYNCFTRETWTTEKRAWCCEHKNLGCPRRTEIASALEEPKYTCMTQELWTSDKRSWCCKHEKLGCPAPADTSALQECYACVRTKGNIYGFQAGEGCFNDTRRMSLDSAAYCLQYTPADVARNSMPHEFASADHAKSCCYIVSRMRPFTKATSITKLSGEMIMDEEVFQPQAQPQFPAPAATRTPSSATLVVVVVALTSLFCCILSCCMFKALCGCLFGGVEDVFDGDGKVGLTGQGEEMGLAGMAGHYLA